MKKKSTHQQKTQHIQQQTKAKEELKKFLASWNPVEDNEYIYADKTLEYARLQKQKINEGTLPKNYTSIDFFNFFSTPDANYGCLKEFSRCERKKLAAKKLAEENPDKLNEQFKKHAEAIEVMSEAMLYVNHDALFDLIRTMEHYIQMAAEYFPEFASYTLKQASEYTLRFIEMSKVGLAFDPDASSDFFLPWPKHHWGELEGFEEVAKHLNLSGKQLNKTSKSSPASPSTRCVIDCILKIEVYRKPSPAPRKIEYHPKPSPKHFRNSLMSCPDITISRLPSTVPKYPRNSKMSCLGIQSFITHDYDGFTRTCQYLPDLNKEKKTFDEWWKVIKPMVEKRYGDPTYGDKKYWENLSSRNPKPDKKKDAWRKACKQALKGLAPKTPKTQ